jgi:NOL1/NOP2/fmu family ribosome biogenesis protein
MRDNVGHQFDRLPQTADEREVRGRATRAEVLAYFEDRYGVEPDSFRDHTFWEKGAGRVWAFSGELSTPQRIEALGLPILRTRQEHWKPTSVGVRRFCRSASANVLVLDRAGAAAFVSGETLEPAWAGDWGYLIVAQVLAGRREPIGVGLYVHGELQSKIPKGDRRSLVASRVEDP